MSKALTIRDRDLGYKALMKSVDTLARESPRVVVGVVGTKATAQHARRDNRGDAPALSVATIAHRHEYGIDVPQRAFIGPTLDTQSRAYSAYLVGGMRKELIAVVKRRAALKAHDSVTLKRLGLRVQGDIKRRILAGIMPPLSAYTLRMKGARKTTPLVDTGQLVSSLNFEVRIK